MPGAQERILRRRIKSVQNTKKITRAMELIAATRVVKAQQRANESRPVQRADHRGHPRPRRRRAPTSTIRCCVRSTTVQQDRRRGASRPTVAWPARTTRRSSAMAEREIQAARAEGKRLRAGHRRPEGEGLLPLPPLSDRRRPSRASPTTRRTRTPVRWPPRSPTLFVNGGCDRVDLVYTRFISLGTQEAVVRRFLPARDRGTRVAADGRARPAEFEFEPSPTRCSRRCCPATSRARLYRRPARRRGLGARHPPAGHEVRHGQRRGADHQAHPRR